MHFSKKSGVEIYFDSCDEESIFIKTLGYNNFNLVAPIKRFRIQQFYTLHIILEGSGTVKVEDRVYTAKKGDMFFIPPYVNLCYYPDEDDPWRYVWFAFVGNNASLYASKMGFSEDNNIKRCKGFDNICTMIERIFANRINNIPVGYYDVLSCFYKILDMNIRKTENQSITDSVLSYIDGHYSEADFSVPDICKKFNISHSYLCRIFKETQQNSVKSYITKVRINEASNLLATTDMNVKEIAYSVGFSDSIHFMKIFKKHKGETPSEYRKKFIANID